jgi:tagatose 1,6-diphosphate aldolase
MLAFDHRGSFKKLMNPAAPEAVTDEQAIKLKRAIIEACTGEFSGLLIDREYGLPALQGLTLHQPFLLPLEKTGYTEQAGERLTELEIDATGLRSLGADGAKLLLYFNPLLDSSRQQLEVAKQAVADCQAQNFPLFLEIVTYNEGSSSRAELVQGSVEMFLAAGVKPDVFKLEYPGDGGSCQKITDLLGDRPWILLTRGETFDLFTDQLKAAMSAGCRGFLAGRALWQEVCTMQGAEKAEFLSRTLPDRFRQLRQIALG